MPDAGRFRSKGVGSAKGNEVSFVAPPADIVKGLLTDLFNYVKKNKDPMLLKSSVFHYEFEFIHPFSDGNGRVGRFWQSLLLSQYNPVFQFIPIEILIKKRQEEYYRVFDLSHAAWECTVFVEFMLSVIYQSLDEMLRSQNMPGKSDERMEAYLQQVNNEFSRGDYMRFWPSLSAASASRDLNER